MPKTTSTAVPNRNKRTPPYSPSLSAMECRTVYRALCLIKKAMIEDRPDLTNPQLVRDYLRFDLALEEREVFACIWLDSQNHLIGAE